MVQWLAGTTVVLGGSVDTDAADLVREETGMHQTGLRGGLVGEEAGRALRVGQSRDVGRKQGFGILYYQEPRTDKSVPLRRRSFYFANRKSSVRAAPPHHTTMLDINLFRTGRTGNGKKKDGDPDAVRESQRKRFASVEIVDEVIDLDDLWRRGKISSLLRGIEALPADLRRISDSQDSRRCRAARSG
jgi:hypothetical protein